VSRFHAFDNAELALLWDGLTQDDGVRYGLPEDSEEWPLAKELFDIAEQRGLVKKAPNRWEHVV
jgi:hypothetical protein